MIRPPSWRAVLGVLVALAVAQVVAGAVPPVAAWLLFLSAAGAVTFLLVWMALALLTLLVAERRERRGHPDEEAAVRAARLRLGMR